ncbi:MAG TPA: hypothetical protein VK963_04805 [Candidatus Saccharimonadales bacterium]|nr:hypothetical protein [Candidatus Saccharimonadales bacterium]
MFGVAVLAGLFITNPSRIGPVGVTLWFVAVLIGLQGALTLVLYFAKRRRELEMGSPDRLTSSWRQGFLVALTVTILLALSSLRQLGLRDVVLILVLVGLVEFYFRTRR